MVDIEDNKPIDKPSPRQSRTVEELIRVFQRLEEDAAAVRVSMPMDQAVPISALSPSPNPSPDSSPDASPRASRRRRPTPGRALPGPIIDGCCDKLKDFLIMTLCVATYGSLIFIFYLISQL